MKPLQTRVCATTLAAAAGLLQPSVAHADDSQFWLELGTKGMIAPDTNLQFKVEQRRQAGPEEYIVAATVERAVAPRLALGGGAEIHDRGGKTEVRPYEQASYSIGPFAMRTRLEERFFDDADHMALRLRQRVQLRQPIAKNLTAGASAELLYQLRAPERGGPQRIDQWRFGAGLTYRARENLELAAGYLFVLRPRDGADRRTHVPQVGLTYRF